jgi:hypothetical protein
VPRLGLGETLPPHLPYVFMAFYSSTEITSASIIIIIIISSSSARLELVSPFHSQTYSILEDRY